MKRLSCKITEWSTEASVMLYFKGTFKTKYIQYLINIKWKLLCLTSITKINWLDIYAYPRDYTSQQVVLSSWFNIITWTCFLKAINFIKQYWIFIRYLWYLHLTCRIFLKKLLFYWKTIKSILGSMASFILINTRHCEYF